MVVGHKRKKMEMVDWKSEKEVTDFIISYFNENSYVIKDFGTEFSTLAPNDIIFDTLYFNDVTNFNILMLIINLSTFELDKTTGRYPLGALASISGGGKSSLLDYIAKFVVMFKNESKVSDYFLKLPLLVKNDLNLTDTDVESYIDEITLFFESDKKVMLPIPITFNKNTNLVLKSEINIEFEIIIRILFDIFAPTTSAGLDFDNFYTYITNAGGNSLDLIMTLKILNSRVPSGIIKPVFVFLVDELILFEDSYNAVVSRIGSLISYENEKLNIVRPIAIISTLDHKYTVSKVLCESVTISKRSIIWLEVPALDFNKLTINNRSLIDVICDYVSTNNVERDTHVQMLNSFSGHSRSFSYYYKFVTRKLIQRFNKHPANKYKFSEIRKDFYLFSESNSPLYSKDWIKKMTVDYILPVLLCKKISIKENVKIGLPYLNSFTGNDYIVPRLSPFLLYCYSQSCEGDVQSLNIKMLLLEILNTDDEVITGQTFELLFSRIICFRRYLLTINGHATIPLSDYIGLYELCMNKENKKKTRSSNFDWDGKIILEKPDPLNSHKIIEVNNFESDYKEFCESKPSTILARPLVKICGNNAGFDDYEFCLDNKSKNRLLVAYELKSQLPTTEKVSYISKETIQNKCNLSLNQFENVRYNGDSILIFSTLKKISNFNDKVPKGINAAFVNRDNFLSLMGPFRDASPLRKIMEDLDKEE